MGDVSLFLVFVANFDVFIILIKCNYFLVFNSYWVKDNDFMDKYLHKGMS